jgi:hypothetical protein
MVIQNPTWGWEPVPAIRKGQNSPRKKLGQGLFRKEQGLTADFSPEMLEEARPRRHAEKFFGTKRAGKAVLTKAGKAGKTGSRSERQDHMVLLFTHPDVPH